jgi:hypothetical protein
MISKGPRARSYGLGAWHRIQRSSPGGRLNAEGLWLNAEAPLAKC